jgi:hypothetical protein
MKCHASIFVYAIKIPLKRNGFFKTWIRKTFNNFYSLLELQLNRGFFEEEKILKKH